MRFNNLPRIDAGAVLSLLVPADRFVVAAGRAAGGIALAGVVLTGLHLEYFDSWRTPVSYGALRSLHWLCGFVLLIDLAYRLCGLGVRLFRLFPGKVRGAWVFKRPAPRLKPMQVLTAGFWAAFLVMLVSGMELAVNGRFDISLLPFGPPLPWVTIHGVASSYLLCMLALRLFFWARTNLGALIPYLRDP